MESSILYRRPRIDLLLQQGLDHSLILLTAGLGYGKTVALDSFFAEKKGVVSLKLSRLDNTPQRFWQNFLFAVRNVFPECAVQLSHLRFPETDVQLDSVLRVFAGELYKKKKAVLLFDDYSALQSPAVIAFVERLAEANLPGVTVVAASSEPTSLSAVCIRGGGRVYPISQSQLRFQPAEIIALFERMKLPLHRENAVAIYRFTDGWALAIMLIIQQIQAGTLSAMDCDKADFSMLHHILSRNHYQSYSKDTQTLLRRLALLRRFTAGVAAQLSKDLPDCGTDSVLESLFLDYDPEQRVYTFHPIYHRLLFEKGYGLPPADQRRIFSLAGDGFVESGLLIDAAECYFHCRRHEDMLHAVESLPLFRMDQNRSGELLRELALLPEPFQREHAVIPFIQAVLHLNCLEVQEGSELLRRLEQTLKEQPEESSRLLLGEVYGVLGSVYLMTNDERFPEYYRLARQLLPNGSRFSFDGHVILGHSSVLSLTAPIPGNLQRMEHLYHQAAPDLQHVLGAGQGLEWLFSAEAAYYTHDIPLARQHAYKTIYLAKEHGQYDIACNGYALLARIGVLQGRYEEFLENLDAVEECAGEHASPRLVEIRDSILGWFAIEMGDLASVPGWILKSVDHHREKPLIDYERTLLIYDCYLFSLHRYPETLTLLEQLEPMCSVRGLWLDLLWVQILKAIVSHHLGRKDDALEFLKKAYDMSYQNEIITPFIECGNHLRGVLELALAAGGDRSGLDPAWCRSILSKASTHSKRVAYVRTAYSTTKQAAANTPALTERERQILNSLAQGLTQKELSDFYEISVNTVKTHMQNIYSKLGAVNRADAIRLAGMYGLLQ